MQSKKQIRRAAIALGAVFALAGCASEAVDEAISDPSTTETQQSHDGHGGMDHPMDGGSAPQGIVEAKDPTYPVGTEVKLVTDHMEGMDGAVATIVGAFDTYTYSVNYTPMSGGDAVIDHKWVVQEEIQGAGEERFEDGAEVTLLAEHMGGMKGALATIASSTDETVYMVDYESDGMEMLNHKWVVESEIEHIS